MEFRLVLFRSRGLERVGVGRGWRIEARGLDSPADSEDPLAEHHDVGEVAGSRGRDLVLVLRKDRDAPDAGADLYRRIERHVLRHQDSADDVEIGRASCRARGWPYV